MPERILFVSFPVDFGNRVLSKNMLRSLRVASDVDYHEFDAGKTVDTSISTSAFKRNIRRASGIIDLRRVLQKARRENRVVVFQQISPALFSIFFVRGMRTFIALDWTRKLYEPILDRVLSSSSTTRIHRIILNSVTGVLAFTKASETSVRDDYHVDSSKIHRVPMPFDHENFAVAPQRSGPPKILFVGADFQRKGGDIIIDWFNQHWKNAELTIVTQAELAKIDKIKVVRNQPGESLSQLYTDHDILALPSRCDAYPQVLGEAASAGLAIATMSTALGASEIVVPGWNGFIADSVADFKHQLTVLIRDRSTIEKFKSNSRLRILQNFTFKKVHDEVIKIIRLHQSN